jgi:hypothetical protein
MEWYRKVNPVTCSHTCRVWQFLSTLAHAGSVVLTCRSAKTRRSSATPMCQSHWVCHNKFDLMDFAQR